MKNMKINGARIIVPPYDGAMGSNLSEEPSGSLEYLGKKSSYDVNDSENYETNTKILALNKLFTEKLGIDMGLNVTQRQLDQMKANSAYSKQREIKHSAINLSPKRNGYKRYCITADELAALSRLNSKRNNDNINPEDNLSQIAQQYMDQAFSEDDMEFELCVVREKKQPEATNTNDLAQKYLESRGVDEKMLYGIKVMKPKQVEESLNPNDMKQLEHYLTRMEDDLGLERDVNSAMHAKIPRKGILSSILGK